MASTSPQTVGCTAAHHVQHQTVTALQDSPGPALLLAAVFLGQTAAIEAPAAVLGRCRQPTGTQHPLGPCCALLVLVEQMH